MISIEQFIILNSCSEDSELFYFPFKDVNSYIQRTGYQISIDLITLIELGYMKCYKIIEKKYQRPINPTIDEFDDYSNYSCSTFEEHISIFGYGPHEFETTGKGLKEISKPEYEQYCMLSGWTE